MNLRTKKILAAKAFDVGKNRIYFNPERLSDIKEAITKQDMLTLKEEGAIQIKLIGGRKKIEKRKRRRGPGKIKMKIKTRKRDYVRLTRKLRRYIKGLRQDGTIDKGTYKDIRVKIRTKSYKSLSGLKEYIESLGKVKKIEKKTTRGIKKK
jgi:large subunit ribosomal protein L19e